MKKLNKNQSMKNLARLIKEVINEDNEMVINEKEKNITSNLKTAKDLKLTSILKTIKNSDAQLTNEQKRQFVKAVEAYNEIAPFVYRDPDTMKAISQSMLMIGRITEQLVTEKTDEWMDLQTVKKDVKIITDSAKQFEKTAQEIMQLQHRLESIFEDVGLKLGKYFSIKELPISSSEETKIDLPKEDNEEKLVTKTISKERDL